MEKPKANVAYKVISSDREVERRLLCHAVPLPRPADFQGGKPQPEGKQVLSGATLNLDLQKLFPEDNLAWTKDLPLDETSKSEALEGDKEVVQDQVFNKDPIACAAEQNSLYLCFLHSTYFVRLRRGLHCSTKPGERGFH